MPKLLETPATRQRIFWGVAGATGVLYLLLVYATQRHQTFNLLTLYTGLFALYFVAYQWVKTSQEIRFFVGAAIIFRLLMFGTMPTLSDDIYRFLWDGYLNLAGINPFVQIPAEYIHQGQHIPGITPQLFEQLNSPQYFSVYPPLCQFIFWLAVKLFPHSHFGATTFIRGLIFLAELGSLTLISRLLTRYKKPQSNLLLYALNPLVILELTGNLHFEAFVIFFLLLALYLLKGRQRILSALAFSLAVITKLLPLMFLPLLLKRLRLPVTLSYYFAVGLLVLASFVPFLNRDFLIGLKDSLLLYFQTFEFNASVYYLVREVGYLFTGYNIIATSGKILAVVSLSSILTYVALEKPNASSLPKAFMWVLAIYLLFTTTVHPWYILPLLTFSLFTRMRFVVVWTYLIFLSYAGYTATGYTEHLWLVILEYIPVIALAIIEIWIKTKRPKKGKASYLVVSDPATMRPL